MLKARILSVMIKVKCNNSYNWIFLSTTAFVMNFIKYFFTKNNEHCVVILDIRSNAYEFFFKFLFLLFFFCLFSLPLLFLLKKNQTTWQQETKIEI